MLPQILDRLRDPVVFALPAIGLLLVVEMLALRFGKDEDAKGFDLRDTRASVLTGLGALVVSTLLRAAALALYAVVYAYVAPFHLPAGAWWTWVLLFFGVEFLLHWYHRAAHAIRLVWAGHQVHHSSEYFNTSTALRRKWAHWFEKLVWLPLPLLGVPRHHRVHHGNESAGMFRVVGPATGAVRPVDTLVDARVHPFDPRLDAAPLFRRTREITDWPAGFREAFMAHHEEGACARRSPAG